MYEHNFNVTVCNNCAGSIVLPMEEHYTRQGLVFCCRQCADTFFDPENPRFQDANRTGL